ncbi:YggT family protein [Actinokineospora pegani]|uniref:YggT family protein n=1 Tax=Actinokineospora pegani TaxID=2654637 RepID=UPI0012EA088F|nr:YggT family protein [Actinokineospora pegani]
MAERDSTGRETRRRDTAAARATAVGLLAAIAGWVGRLIALVLVLHVVLVMGNANPDNPIASFVAGIAEPLALAFKTLFTPEDAKLGLLVNYGLAAVFWLVVTSVVTRLIRRLG